MDTLKFKITQRTKNFKINENTVQCVTSCQNFYLITGKMTFS